MEGKGVDGSSRERKKMAGGMLMKISMGWYLYDGDDSGIDMIFFL